MQTNLHTCAQQMVVVVALSAVMMLAGQRLGAQTPDSAQFHCDGRTISAIEIDPRPPAMIGRDPSAFRRAVQHFLFQSGTTRERAIRPFILAHVGQRCENAWLPELARVVRAQPYLSAATVRAESDSRNGVR